MNPAMKICEEEKRVRTLGEQVWETVFRDKIVQIDNLDGIFYGWGMKDDFV